MQVMGSPTSTRRSGSALPAMDHPVAACYWLAECVIGSTPDLVQRVDERPSVVGGGLHHDALDALAGQPHVEPRIAFVVADPSQTLVTLWPWMDGWGTRGQAVESFPAFLRSRPVWLPADEPFGLSPHASATIDC